MEVTATEAKSRFGQMLDHAQREPVFIGKSGRRHGVLLSAAHYDALVAAAQPQQAEREPRTADAFYAKYKAGIDECNERVQRYGIPGEEFRVC